MIFEKPSLRTRVTFEVGMTSMGGFAIYLDHSKPRLGERESIKDVARNLDRWVNGIVARTFSLMPLTLPVLCAWWQTRQLLSLCVACVWQSEHSLFCSEEVRKYG